MKGKEKLLEAAFQVFALRGFHGASVGEIAKEAGVSKALFFHHFKNKEELLVIFAKKRLEMWEPLVEGLEKEIPASDRLNFLVDFVLQEVIDDPMKLRLVYMLYLTQEGMAAIASAMDRFKPLFDRLFTAEHKLFADLGFKDPILEATFFRSTLQGIVIEHLLAPSYPLQEIRNTLIRRYIKCA